MPLGTRVVPSGAAGPNQETRRCRPPPHLQLVAGHVGLRQCQGAATGANLDGLGRGRHGLHLAHHLAARAAARQALHPGHRGPAHAHKHKSIPQTLSQGARRRTPQAEARCARHAIRRPPSAGLVVKSPGPGGICPPRSPAAASTASAAGRTHLKQVDCAIRIDCLSRHCIVAAAVVAGNTRRRRVWRRRCECVQRRARGGHARRVGACASQGRSDGATANLQMEGACVAHSTETGWAHFFGS